MPADSTVEQVAKLEQPSQQRAFETPLWSSPICPNTFRLYQLDESGILWRHHFAYGGIDADFNSTANWRMPVAEKPESHLITRHGELLLVFPGGQLFTTRPADDMPGFLPLSAAERLGELIDGFVATVIEEFRFGSGAYESIWGTLIGGHIGDRGVVIWGARSVADTWRLLTFPESVGPITSMVFCGGHSQFKIITSTNQLFQVGNIHLPALLGHER